MSPSINRTFWLISAKEIPRLQTTVVFPSLGLALVSTRRRGRSAVLLRENRMDVSVVRNDSASKEVFWRNEIISTRESNEAPFENPSDLSARFGDPTPFFGL